MHSSRKQRGVSQKIFLIESHINKENYEGKFMIMGSTGNVYEVVIKNNPTCTCPDYTTRNKRCKHIYFVLLRIMKVVDEDKNDYNAHELETMFNHIPNITNNLVIDDSSKKIYEKLKHEKDNKNNDKIKMKDTNDLCPICLDDLDDGNELDYCKFSCGKPIHKICFSMWIKKKESKCVFCSHNWYGDDKQNIYINLNNKK